MNDREVARRWLWACHTAFVVCVPGLRGILPYNQGACVPAACQQRAAWVSRPDMARCRMGWASKTIGGKQVDTMTQDADNTCGVAAAAMVIRWVRGRPVSYSNKVLEEAERAELAKEDKKLLRQTQTGELIKEAKLKAAMERKTYFNEKYGVFPDMLAEFLRTLGIRATHIDGPTVEVLRKRLKAAKSDGSRPVIVGVPQHWMVVHSHADKLSDSTRYYAVDPANGGVFVGHLLKDQPNKPRLKFINAEGDPELEIGDMIFVGD
jgi:hypothetical protein